MSDTAQERRPATYADIEALPPHVVGEIIDGELIVSPRPATRHAFSATAFGFLIVGPFQYGANGPGGWWIVYEPEVHLDPHVVVPDVAGWRRERLPEYPDAKYFTLAPDWVCEVLSPSTEKTDRIKKLAVYSNHGVQHVWLVHPIHQTIEVYRLDGDTYRRIAAYSDSDKEARVEPFDAIELKLHYLWGVDED